MEAPWTQVGKIQQEINDLQHKLSDKANQYIVFDLENNLKNLQIKLINLENEISYIKEDIRGLKEREKNNG